ncbi:MAG: PD40 domain-containing protein [Planctomycetaceae bacterium]|nr:PD40 domain-containing protein [Planctomycetaceae bacterium]
MRSYISVLLSLPLLAVFLGCEAAPRPMSEMDYRHVHQEHMGEVSPLGQGGWEFPVTKLTNAEVYDYGHPNVSMDGKWLAYASNANRGQADVYLQPMDGFAARQLTHGPGSNIHPAISPDSSMVAFASNRDGKYRIYAMSTKGSGRVEEVSDPNYESMSPTWSPCGMKVAFATRMDDKSPWMIAVRCRNSGQISYLREGMFPDWSPFGDSIVFQRTKQHEPGYSAVYTMRSDGSELTLVYHSDTHGAITPAWAGGEWIVFATVNKSEVSKVGMGDLNADDIWMVKRDGTQASLLTQHRRADWDPCFDNTRRRVVYVSDCDGCQNIYAVDTNMAGPRVDGYSKLFGGGE